jgi:hypothetical protein
VFTVPERLSQSIEMLQWAMLATSAPALQARLMSAKAIPRQHFVMSSQMAAPTTFLLYLLENCVACNAEHRSDKFIFRFSCTLHEHSVTQKSANINFAANCANYQTTQPYAELPPCCCCCPAI